MFRKMLAMKLSNKFKNFFYIIRIHHNLGHFLE